MKKKETYHAREEAAPDNRRRGAQGLGLDVKQVERLAPMSQEERVKATSA